MTQKFDFNAPSFSTWDSSSGPENLPPYPPVAGRKKKLVSAVLTAAENARFTKDGGVQIRLGFINKGSLGTGAKVDSIKGFETDQFNVLFMKSGTKIFQSNNPDVNTPNFYDIGVTRTASQKDFFFAKRKDMIATNQVDSQCRIYCTVAQGIDVANSRFTIPQGDLDDLSATGSVYIRGIAVSYTKAVTFTADASADTLTAANHGVVNGTILTVSNTGGALPTGLVAGTTYFAISATANTFQVSLTLGGVAVDITGSGSGTNTFVAEDGIVRGASGLTGAMAAGDIITQTTLYSANPKAACISELLGAQIAGGVLADASSLKYSVQSTQANPQYFFDFSGTGNGSKPMPRDIRALLAGTSVTLIGLSKGLQYGTDFNSDGALLTTSLSTVHSIPNAQSVIQTDEDFLINTGEGRVLPVGQTNAGFKVLEDAKNPRNDLDYPVQGYIQRYIDKTNTSNNFLHYDPSLRLVSNCIMLQTGITTEIVLSTDNGGWSRDTSKNFSCKTTFKGRTYCGADSTDTIYLQDEGIDDDGLDIGFRIVSSLMNYGGGQIEIEPQGLVIGGLLSAVGMFTVNVLTDSEQAFTFTVTAQQLIEKGLMSVNSGNPLGGGQVGANRIGNGSSGVDVFPFVFPLDLLFSCKKIQIEILSTDAIEIRNFNIPVETEGEELSNTF